MRKHNNLIKLASYTCFIACAGEFIFMFILGAMYPGYNHLKNTMSSLGASKSPVSFEMSSWWVCMGILMIIFGLGFRRAFSDAGKKGIFASWLLILYGFGEGIGSGVFKADRIPIGFTFSGLFHDIVGGIGVTAILIFPLVMPGIFKSVKGKTYKVFSFLTFIISIASIILFLFRYSPDETDFLSVYKGLWQRIFMLSVYGYLSFIAFLMINKESGTRENP